MTSSKNENSFKLKDLPSLLKETYIEWDRNQPWRLSAIVAYYAVLSLPAFVIISLNLIGAIWGKEIIEGMLFDEFSSLIGPDAAIAIQAIITSMQAQQQNLLSTIISIAVLLYGTTGVFYHLQLSLNQVWSIKLYDTPSFRRIAFDRLKSFVFVLVIGFLLLISLVATTLISAINDYTYSNYADLVPVAYTFDIIISLFYSTILFALIFRFLPDAIIKWSTVWIGAFITSILFVIGKFSLGYYFGTFDPSSIYGAAGSIILILIWVSYSCAILFFGAQFTWVYANKYGIGIQPYRIAFLDKHENGKNENEI